ncbi:gamma-glutamyltransferase family protein [Paroceanicella profunda]|uniref:Gamma-glutamyltransferase family protein n=1 Tax=Paroceanicella profunda TaxID=2579971 RepID=A0A5B8FHP5_9RHOB|nr:gamma-glutamyltransferase family protein [Paroceanicella profunda]QDL92691.1 gamma-glutamyltransferase family protein [Paroceanicella profunda]
MDHFTTRPEIRGTFGAVATTHWIASAVGFGVLERGGNAFDAAVAAGLVLQVVEPHLNGPAGDLPVIFHAVREGRTEVLCAQGTAPRAATVARYRAEGLEEIPGSGLLSTVIPGAFDGWMLMLRDHGTLSLREALGPALGYARDGHPLLARAAEAIAGLAPFFAAKWPSSAAVWTPGGVVPRAGALFANPDLAATWTRLLTEAEAAGDSREAQIDAARSIFRNGFVAEAIAQYLSTARVEDASGSAHGGVLDRADMAGWRAHYEPTVHLDYAGWTLHKTGPWGQGPVLLQALAILRGVDIAGMDPMGVRFVHTVTEAIKLAWADREAYYGDPAWYDIPMRTLLSEEYAATRRALIGPEASLEQRPGHVRGYEHLARAAVARAAQGSAVRTDASSGEPTMAHLSAAPGDTVHLDVADRWGNIVSATPSGGWLQSSPVIPGLGFPLNSRAQMFWLDEGLPSSLGPGRRPRTTLTPTLAEKNGTRLAFGTPGGDQQDQWQLIWFLRMVHHGFDLQQGMDAPLFHSAHFQSSFSPRRATPGALFVEQALGEETIAGLRRRGHRVTVAPDWSLGRLTAVMRTPDGQVQAAATPRLQQAYAIGR